MELTVAGFKGWLKSLPTDTMFNSDSCQNCAIAQYLKASGCTGVTVGVTRYTANGEPWDIPFELSEVIRNSHYPTAAEIIKMLDSTQ